MRKVLLIIFLLITLNCYMSFAQDSSVATDTAALNELFMLNKPQTARFKQIYVAWSYLGWLNLPENIKTKSFDRSVNIFGVFNLLKKKAHFNIGVGLATDFLNLKSNAAKWNFDSSGKVTTVPDSMYDRNKAFFWYLGVPVELKFKLGKNPDKGVNLGLGFKVNTLLYSTIKNKLGNTTTKVRHCKELNQWTYSVYGYLGYKYFSIFGQYNINSLFNAKNAPDTRYWSLGLALMI
jgi:hypothetical protein